MSAVGAAGAFGIYAGICLIGYVFILFTYPEVSGLSLEEVQSLWGHGKMGGFGISKSHQIRKAHKLAAKKAAAGARADAASSAEKI